MLNSFQHFFINDPADDCLSFQDESEEATCEKIKWTKDNIKMADQEMNKLKEQLIDLQGESKDPMSSSGDNAKKSY